MESLFTKPEWEEGVSEQKLVTRFDEKAKSDWKLRIDFTEKGTKEVKMKFKLYTPKESVNDTVGN